AARSERRIVRSASGAAFPRGGGDLRRRRGVALAQLDLVAEDARVVRLHVGNERARQHLALAARQRAPPLPASRDRNGADDGHHEQRARELEGNERAREEHAPEGVDAAERGRNRGNRIRAPRAAKAAAAREDAEPGEREEAPAEDARHEALPIRWRLVVRAEQHDDEEEQDDDRAGVDDELDRRQELRVEREEEARDAQDEQQEPHRGANRVLGYDDGQRPGEGERRARVGVDGHEGHRQLQGSTVSVASARLRSPRTYCSNSARNFWMKASAGIAVPSPKAQ